MRSIIITTTNNIEGRPVTKYLDFVCANVVLGVNMFSDIAASFTDIFGGKSSSYQNKLELIQKDVIKDLKEKASRIGANAILSCRIDFDEISGGGKSMFMVSASGTACIIEDSKTTSIELKNNMGIVTDLELRIQLKKEAVYNKLSEDGFSISNNDFEFLLDYPQNDFTELLCSKYLLAAENGWEEHEAKFLKLLSKIDTDTLIEIAYKKLKENKHAEKLIHELNLFSAEKIMDLIDSRDYKLALKVICSDSSSYSMNDLELMSKISAFYDSLPDTGKLEFVKGGILGKESEKFICENGHKNSSETEFCEKCAINIKGLMYNEAYNLYKFKNKVKTLGKLMNQSDN